MMPVEQIEAALASGDRRLMEMAHRCLSNPVWSFKPRVDKPWECDEQSAFLEQRHPGIACVLGGTGSGKSHAAAVKVARFLLTTPPPRPNTPFWILSTDLPTAAGVCWKEKLSQFITPEYIKDVHWYNSMRGFPESIIMKKHSNGNEWNIDFKSVGMERQRLQGASIGGFWIDEACPHEILMEVLMRTRDYDLPGSRMYTLTPIAADLAELEKIYNEAHKYPFWKFYRLNSKLNTALPEGFIDAALDFEVEERKETRLTGAFSSFIGQIYKAFSPRLHVIEPFNIPRGWWHMRSIDFGFNHPTVCLWAARDNDDRYYIYREHYASGLSIDEHVEAIKSVPWDDNDPYYGCTWSDYAAAQERHEFKLAGLPTQPAFKDVLTGIGAVQRALRAGADGKPRLFFFDTCENLIREMKTYSYHPVLDKPNKGNDDAVDALRYLISSEAKHAVLPWEPPRLRQRPIKVNW